MIKMMKKNMNVLRIIRGIATIPFAILLITAIYNSVEGAGGFFGESTYGVDAFLLTILAFFIMYWWVWAVCLIIIITTNILIKRNFKEEKKNDFVSGNQETGMIRQHIKPLISRTGEDLLKALLINGKYANYEAHFSDMDIYIALRRCQSLCQSLPLIPYCDREMRKLNKSTFSIRQAYCSNAALELIMKNKYNHALHEFENCIDDYGKGKGRVLTSNEIVLYNSILTCFIRRLEEQSDNVQVMRMVAEKTLNTLDEVDKNKS